MAKAQVNIDFKVLGLAFQKYIREKATKSGGTILYKEGNLLIEENPKTLKRTTIKKYIKY